MNKKKMYIVFYLYTQTHAFYFTTIDFQKCFVIKLFCKETLDVAAELPASVDVVDNREKLSLKLFSPVKQKKSKK